jgi:hypothetical protein
VGGQVEKEDCMKMDSFDPSSSPTVGVGMKRKLRRGLFALLQAGILAGLLYAALYIKPAVTSKSLPLPVVESRDRFYGVVPAGSDLVYQGRRRLRRFTALAGAFEGRADQKLSEVNNLLCSVISG